MICFYDYNFSLELRIERNHLLKKEQIRFLCSPNNHIIHYLMVRTARTQNGQVSSGINRDIFG